jgi:hypothetical protein
MIPATWAIAREFTSPKGVVDVYWCHGGAWMQLGPPSKITGAIRTWPTEAEAVTAFGKLQHALKVGDYRAVQLSDEDAALVRSEQPGTKVETVEAVVVDDMNADEARAITDRIRTALEDVWELIKQAYTRRAWVALGYTSWDTYVSSELDRSLLRLPREERTEIVTSLRHAGLSTRAIAAACVARIAAPARERIQTGDEDTLARCEN